MRSTLFTLFILLAIIVQSQKKPLIVERDQVIERARTELDSAMQSPEGELFVLAGEYGISGTYIFDISIREKGKVASVFCVERPDGTIKMQNILKDLVKEFKFNFKMPKGKSFKFQYTFQFN